MNNIKEILISKYEYTDYEAEVTSEDLNNMDPESMEVLSKLLEGNDISDYSYMDYSIGSLISDYDFNPFSALLSIVALKDDYEGFSKMLKKGFK